MRRQTETSEYDICAENHGKTTSMAWTIIRSLFDHCGGQVASVAR
jgi:hypothetical protein